MDSQRKVWTLLTSLVKVLGVVGAAAGVADQGKRMGSDRAVRRNLADLFRENFVTADGSLRPGFVEAKAAGLRFVRSTDTVKDWSGSEYYLVRVINDAKPGDDPDHVRRMGYFPRTKKIGFPPTWLENY